MLDELLVGEVFALFLCFVRLGAFLSQAPGIGEKGIPMNIRLYTALLISLVLTPIISPYLPKQPPNVLHIFLLIIGEITIGLFIGICFKILVSALIATGEFISFLIGLTSIQSIAPSLGTPGSPHAVILVMVSSILILEFGIHFEFLELFVASYSMMPAGEAPLWEDMSTKIIDLTNLIFKLALQLAGVFFVILLPANLFIGIISRLMPAIQAYFVMLPGQLLLGIWLFSFMVPAVMYVFFIHMEELIFFFKGQ